MGQAIEPIVVRSWFDRLTMSGIAPLVLSLSKGERRRRIDQGRSWFDKLTMSGWVE